MGPYFWALSTLNLEASLSGKLFNPAKAGLDWPGLGDKLPFGQSPKNMTPSVLLFKIMRPLLT